MMNLFVMLQFVLILLESEGLLGGLFAGLFAGLFDENREHKYPFDSK